MASVCARCGTANPDGNRFCQACGAELVAAAPAPAVPVGAVAASPFTQPPPAYAAPPAAAPPGPPQYYQSPYYAPGAGAMQPPVHRTPWVMIVAVVVVLVLVMAGVGTVLAVGLSHSNNQAGTLSELSSPSPQVSPSARPTASPSALPPVVSQTVTVPVPNGWTAVDTETESITLIGPNTDGTITIASGSSSPPQTAQQNKETIDAFFTQQYPDTKSCGKTTTGSLNGVTGISWELCFTLTEGAQSAPAASLLFVGANADGSVYYAMYMLALASNIQNFSKEAAPVIKGIVWNLK